MFFGIAASSNFITSLLQVNCATDFVAKTSEFQNIVNEAADIVLNKFSTDKKVQYDCTTYSSSNDYITTYDLGLI